MHRAHLSFDRSRWHVSFNNGDRISNDVLASLIPEVWTYTDSQWGPYDRPSNEVDIFVAPGRTPMDVPSTRTLLTSVYDAWSGDAPYETAVLLDEDDHRTELHRVTYNPNETSTQELQLSIDDIIKLVPALSVAGGRMTFSKASAAMLEEEDDRFTPDSLASAMGAWPPPWWKRIGFVR